MTDPVGLIRKIKDVKALTGLSLGESRDLVFAQRDKTADEIAAVINADKATAAIPYVSKIRICGLHVSSNKIDYLNGMVMIDDLDPAFVENEKAALRAKDPDIVIRDLVFKDDADKLIGELRNMVLGY